MLLRVVLVQVAMFPFLCTQEQNELVWKTRDELQACLSTTELKQLLLANHQAVPSGESRVRTP